MNFLYPPNAKLKDTSLSPSPTNTTANLIKGGWWKETLWNGKLTTQGA